MVEFGTEIAPERSAVSGLPPRGESQSKHVQNAECGCWTDCPSEQQRKAYEEFHRADEVPEEDSVGQDEPCKEGTKEIDGAGLNVVLQIVLKAAVSECGAGHLIFPKQKEED